MVLGCLQLTAVGVDLLGDPHLLLLLLSQLAGGDQHGRHLRLGPVLGLHGVDLRGQLLLLLFELGQFLFQFCGVLNGGRVTSEEDYMPSYSSCTIWNSACSSFICSLRRFN